MTRPSAKPESAEATALAAESTEELRVEIKPTGTEPSSQQSPGKKSKQGKLVQAKSLDQSRGTDWLAARWRSTEHLGHDGKHVGSSLVLPLFDVCRHQ